MNTLIIYATNSGSTFEVANLISAKLAEKSHQVEVKNVTEVTPDVIPNYELVLLGSPSWEYEGQEGFPQADFVAFMNNTPQDQTFPQTKFAVFGLGDKNYAIFCGAVDHMMKYVEKLQGQLVSEPLKIDAYYNDMAAGQAAVESWLETQLLPKLRA